MRAAGTMSTSGFSGPVSPTVALFGAWLEVGDERFNNNEIQRLYQADDYSLRKTE